MTPAPIAGDPTVLPLAVYGSLRWSTGRLGELGVTGDLEPLGCCRIAGRLVDLGDFPGLVPGPGLVHGELYRFTRATTLDVLDAYEACLPGEESASLFVRRAVRLLAPARLAWVYHYNRPIEGFSEVASGDWLAHVAARPPGAP